MKATLQEYNNLAYTAFAWTSFDLQGRGERTISSHEAELNADLESISEATDDEQQRYINGYKKRFSAWLSAHSRCASSAITGGSGFNVRRANKANDIEHRRYGELIEYREKVLPAIKKTIEKRIESAKTPEQKTDELYADISKSIIKFSGYIVAINRGEKREFSKIQCINAIYKIIKCQAEHGNLDIVHRCLVLVGKINERYPNTIQEKNVNKMWELYDVAEKQSKIIKEKVNYELIVDDTRFLLNYDEDRLQIFFVDKPDQETITTLKKNGFKWSPRFGAWQRQLTLNAIYATNRLFNVNLHI